MSQPTIDPTALTVAAVPARLASLARLRARAARIWSSFGLAIAVALVAAGQLVEDSLDSPPLQLLSLEASGRRWTVIVAVLYLIATSRFVDTLVERSRGTLDRAFAERPAQFDRYVGELRRLPMNAEIGLFLASAAVVIALFAGVGISLPTDDPVSGRETYMPPMGLAAVIIAIGYAIVGWSLVSLVSGTIRRAWAIRQLSREPLAIDVFNTANLLPLGNIALGTSLAPAGVIVILLIGYGRPSQPLSWAILLVAMLASVLALILPLRRIHNQMSRAKLAAQATLNAQLRAVYDRLDGGVEIDDATTSVLHNRSSTLVALRQTVNEMTTWPFRDTLAFSRAVLIASAPIIYTVVTELIKVFWINPLAP